MIQAQEIEQITNSLPGVAIPMRVTAVEHLEVGTLITLMMLLKRTGTHPTPIERYIVANHLDNILRLPLRLNAFIPRRVYP